MTTDRLILGMLVFPEMTNLDFAGPYEVLARLPGVETHVLWKSVETVRSDAGLSVLPTTALAEAPPLDIVFVPGGPGQMALMEDDEILSFLAAQGARARWVTSVCTGALVLGAAGLLAGYRATTHWLSLDQLALFGAEPVRQRIVVDRNRITGGGVTAGIDFGLSLAALIVGEAAAQRVQLFLEYDPQPPFRAGSPEVAPPGIVAEVRGMATELVARRRAISERAAARLARRQ